MPNWVKNRITMKGISNEPLFKTYGNEGMNFDFNTLIPMPEELNLIDGSIKDEAMTAYISSKGIIRTVQLCMISARSLGVLPKKDTFDYPLETIMERLLNKYPAKDPFWDEPVCYKNGSPDKLPRYEVGKLYCDNIKKYGRATWYGWTTRNWGTKWNASSTEIEGPDTIGFDTAWSMPEPVLVELSKRYPTREITVIWADEDTGSNAGQMTLLNGEVVDGGYFENDSNEAYRAYIELWGDSRCIGVDENGNYYHKDCDTCHGCD